jgi:hypothetical protein
LNTFIYITVRMHVFLILTSIMTSSHIFDLSYLLLIIYSIQMHLCDFYSRLFSADKYINNDLPTESIANFLSKRKLIVDI